MPQSPRNNPRISTIILVTVILTGFGITLRWFSFSWNTRLYGDVNLFALTARQIAQSGQLNYPMKYDYSTHVPYFTLNSPAGQHPPLFPLMAGELARLIGVRDTFLILKALTYFWGIILLGLFLYFTLQQSSVSRWVGLSLVSLSPWLVDYSANGSPYILIACLLLMAHWLWRTWDETRMKTPLLAGILCAISWLTHGILIALSIAFLIRIIFINHQKPSLVVKQALSFILAFAIPILPWLVWNQKTFLTPFYSASSTYLMEQLGLSRIQIQGQGISWVIQPLPISQLFNNYAMLVSKAAYAGLKESVAVLTPWGGILVLAGIYTIVYGTIHKNKSLNKNGSTSILKKGIYLLCSPLGLYILTVLFWATYKLRFLIPILPFLYWGIGVGTEWLIQQANWRKWVGWGLLAGTLVSMSSIYLQPKPNLYYGFETTQNTLMYDQMQPMAVQLGQLPKGVVLGVSHSLDGGIETIYWSEQHFVAGRGFDPDIWIKLARDFKVRYIWSDRDQEQTIMSVFPDARMILANNQYLVYQLP